MTAGSPRASQMWPDLAYKDWRDTAATLQLWMQIVGKVRLALTPWLNHSWQVPFYVTARGLGTSPIPFGSETFDIEFDFVTHSLVLRPSWTELRKIALAPQSVAAFYARFLEVLHDAGITVTIDEMPNELPDPVPFSRDRVHASYDAEAVHRFWRALVNADRILKLFRTAFLGKASPVHFFWGGFDLAVTRFSGRTAPPHPGGIPGLPNAVTREAYSHEVSSAGFWPGNDTFPEAAFYSYAYPEPPNFRTARVTPPATYNTTLGEFILPYGAVRTSEDPQALLLDFLFATYTAAATNGGWNRSALECTIGVPGRVRPV